MGLYDTLEGRYPGLADRLLSMDTAPLVDEEEDPNLKGIPRTTSSSYSPLAERLERHSSGLSQRLLAMEPSFSSPEPQKLDRDGPTSEAQPIEAPQNVGTSAQVPAYLNPTGAISAWLFGGEPEASAARAAGDRPSLSKQLTGAIGQATEGIMSKITPDFLIGDPEGERAMKAAGPAPWQAPLPEPASGLEKATQVLGGAVPDLAMGVATGGISTVGAAGLASRGAGSLVSTLGGEALQSLALLPVDLMRFEPTTAIGVAFASSVFGTAIQKLLGAGVREATVGDIAQVVSREAEIDPDAAVRNTIEFLTQADELEAGSVTARGLTGGPEGLPVPEGGGRGFDELLEPLEPSAGIRIGSATSDPEMDALLARIGTEGQRFPEPSDFGRQGPTAAERIALEASEVPSEQAGFQRLLGDEDLTPAPRTETGFELQPDIEPRRARPDILDLEQLRVGRSTGLRSGGDLPAERTIQSLAQEPIGGGMPPREAFEGPGQQERLFAGGEKGPKTEKLVTSEAALDEILKTGRLHGVEVNMARRGTMSIDEISDRADLILSDPKQVNKLFNRPIGAAFNAEEALAIKRLHVENAEYLVSSSRRLLENPTAEAQELLNRAWKQHNLISYRLAGATAETGRALRTFTEPVESSVQGVNKIWASGRLKELANEPIGGGMPPREAFSSEKTYKKAVKAAQGDPDQFRKLAEEIVKMADDPGAMSKVLLRSPGAPDFIHELRLAGMLSSPPGRIRDAVSTVYNVFVQEPLEGVVRSSVSPNEFLGSVPEGIKGGVWAMPEAARVFAKSWYNGRSAFGASGVGPISRKLLPRHRGFRFEGDRGQIASAIEDWASRGGLRGVAGKAALPIKRVFLDVVQAIDDAGKTMSGGSTLASEAYNQARREVVSGVTPIEGLQKRIADIVENPSEEILSKMQKKAQQQTFQDKSWASDVVMQARRVPGARHVVPFARTQANIAQWIAERDLFLGTAISVGKRAAKKAPFTTEEFAENVAKPAVGGMLYLAGASLWAGGVITGSKPRIGSSGDIAEEAGWQPYSIKIGDTYTRMDRVPVGQQLALAADIAQAASEDNVDLSDRLMHILNGYAMQLALPGALKSYNDFFDALPGGPFSRLTHYHEDFLLSFIPSIIRWAGEVNQAITAEGPVYKTTQESFGERLSKQLGGFRGELFPREGPITGRPIEDARGALGTALSVGTTTRVTSPEEFAAAMRAEGVDAKIKDFTGGYFGGGRTDAQAFRNMLRRHSVEEVLSKTEEVIEGVKTSGIALPRSEKERIAIDRFEPRAERLKVEDRNKAVDLLAYAYKARWATQYVSGDRAGAAQTLAESKRYGLNINTKSLREGIESLPSYSQQVIEERIGER